MLNTIESRSIILEIKHLFRRTDTISCIPVIFMYFTQRMYHIGLNCICTTSICRGNALVVYLVYLILRSLMMDFKHNTKLSYSDNTIK